MCHKKNRRKNKINTLNQNQQSDIDNTIHRKPLIKISFDNKTCQRHLIFAGSGCRKKYITNYILLRKQEPSFIITKSLSQYPNIKAQTSDESQKLEIDINNCIVFDDMFPSKQESNFGLFFTRGGHCNIDIFSISQS